MRCYRNAVLTYQQTTKIRTFNFSEFNISDLISLSRASLTEGDKHIDSNKRFS